MKELYEKYARLAIQIGGNIQKDQFVVINGDVRDAWFIKMMVKEAYKAGAREVYVNYQDEDVEKMHYEYQTVENLSHIPEWRIAQRKYFIDSKMATLSVRSPRPGSMKDVDRTKMMAQMKASREAFAFAADYTRTSQGQWLGFCLPSYEWAEMVYPDLDREEAFKRLEADLFEFVLVDQDSDPVENWRKLVDEILRHRQVLTDYAFDRLVFKNNKGTDIEVGLIDQHAWAGGAEFTPEGVAFTPNLPTLEIFCCPDKNRVNGKVYATKPLFMQNTLVKDFYFEFKDGRVVDYGASEGLEALESLINTDEGAKHLGEVALVAHSSPISKKNVLFYNGLIDENASCHLALGNCYASNFKEKLSKEEMSERGGNFSNVHCDFMFGSEDMKVVGYTKDNQEVLIMDKGEFVI